MYPELLGGRNHGSPLFETKGIAYIRSKGMVQVRTVVRQQDGFGRVGLLRVYLGPCLIQIACEVRSQWPSSDLQRNQPVPDLVLHEADELLRESVQLTEGSSQTKEAAFNCSMMWLP